MLKDTAEHKPLEMAVVTPTYNEVANIEKLLTKIHQVSRQHPEVSFTCLVVDDSSPDGTADEVVRISKELHSENFNIDLVVRTKKDGLGKAYVHGFQYILEKYPHISHVLQMDADLSHDPIYISSFIHQIKDEADLIVASRYIKGGGTPDWGWHRKLLSRFGNIYTRIFLGSKIHDYTGGYNLYSRQLLHDINLNTLQASGYGFLIELKYRALRHAKTVREVPIVFMDRTQGTSKIPRSTIFKNLLLVPRVRFSKKAVASHDVVVATTE